MNQSDIIVYSKWPKTNSEMINPAVESNMNFVMLIISAVRNLKSELNISPKKEIVMVCRGIKEKTSIILNNEKYFTNLIKVKDINCYEKIEKPDQSSTLAIDDVEIFIPLADLIDLDKEVIRLKDKISDYEGRIKSVKKKIDNKNFITRAPKEIVEHEKKKYLNYKNDYNKLKNNLNSLI